jgi:hypothetical protein
MGFKITLRHPTKLFMFVVIVIGGSVFNHDRASAQDLRAQNPSQTRPEVTAPSKPASPILPSGQGLQPTVQVVPVHHFWDRTNLLLFSGVAVTRGMDYASTHNFQARGREEILLPDDVVDNSAGFASLEAAGTMTSVGISYLLHRTGHHKLERWMSIGHIGVTAFGDVRNYSLESRHRVTPAR